MVTELALLAYLDKKFPGVSKILTGNKHENETTHKLYSTDHSSVFTGFGPPACLLVEWENSPCSFEVGFLQCVA